MRSCRGVQLRQRAFGRQMGLFDEPDLFLSVLPPAGRPSDVFDDLLSRRFALTGAEQLI